MKPVVICWFRQDLRLADNPALEAALASDQPVVALYVHDGSVPEQYQPGGAARWWLHHSLSALDESLRKRGNKLILRSGQPAKLLAELCEQLTVSSVHWNRVYEPFAIARDKKIKQQLSDAGIEVQSYKGALLFEPWEIKTQQGTPYKVFTQYWRRGCLASGIEIPPPRSAPDAIPATTARIATETLSDWQLRPTQPNWASEFSDTWQPGETGALKRMEQFLENGLAGYRTLRDRPDLEHVSRLSAHLHWGEIAPWRPFHAAAAEGAARRDVGQRDVDHFQSELGWREFSYQLLYYNPTLPEQNWRDAFDAFPWSKDNKGLTAWQRGRTGYPLVDAGMRQLWSTGWMHNRVRMVVASFLIKHLLIHWQHGERWFWDTLVDADLANNSASWQWVAGSGADAAPFFRIFNPITQGEKFDPEGDYIRRWIPELAKLDTKALHRPWEADEAALADAGVVLDETYPRPIVDHREARERALAAYQSTRG